MLILIAGPYRSGTGDDPAKMAAPWPIFHAGHIPMIGEWVAAKLDTQLYFDISRLSKAIF